MTRVVVGMSGGVDSSVAAALAQRAGLRCRRHHAAPVVRASRSYGEDGVELAAENKCCSLESVSDARRVAAALDIPFYVVNVEEPFRETIVDYFYDEYAAGRTPNPCLRCNRHIRFTLLLERALALGADYLATGHYVRVDDDPRRACAGCGGRWTTPRISPTCCTCSRSGNCGTRSSRWASIPSQRCARWRRSAACPWRPRPRARRSASSPPTTIAASCGATPRPPASAAPQPAPILDAAGTQVGEHQGLAYYTVGQRKGLGVSAREPLHVLRLDRRAQRRRRRPCRRAGPRRVHRAPDDLDLGTRLPTSRSSVR